MNQAQKHCEMQPVQAKGRNPTSSQRKRLGKPDLIFGKNIQCSCLAFPAALRGWSTQCWELFGARYNLSTNLSLPWRSHTGAKERCTHYKALSLLKQTSKTPKLLKYRSPDLSQPFTLEKTLLANSCASKFIGKDMLLVPGTAPRSLAANGLRAQGWI